MFEIFGLLGWVVALLAGLYPDAARAVVERLIPWWRPEPRGAPLPPAPDLQGRFRLLKDFGEGFDQEYEFVKELTLHPVVSDGDPSLEDEIERLRARYLEETSQVSAYCKRPGASFEEYEAAYRSTWPMHRARIAMEGRIFKLWFAITNVGRLPAEDVDFYIDFPESFEFFTELPPWPQLPEWPLVERVTCSVLEQYMGPSSSFGAWPSAPSLNTEILDPFKPTVRVRDRRVVFGFKDLKHGHLLVRLPELYVVVPRDAGVYSLACEGTAANLPDPTLSEMVLRIEPVHGGDELQSRLFEHLCWIHPPRSYADLLDEDAGEEGGEPD